MSNEEVFIKEKLGRRNPFTVPEGYFDQLAGQIIDQLPAEETGLPNRASVLDSRIAVIRRFRPLLYAAACFAVAIFGVTIYLNKHFADDQLQLAQQQEMAVYSDAYIEEAVDYAMLDNDDIYAGLLADI